MQRKRTDPRLTGFKADHCFVCDRTDRPLRQAGAAPNRMTCTPCGVIWNALPQHLDDVNKSYRVVEWRDAIVAA